MSNYLHQLNKAFENRSRLGIMSVLAVNERVDFNRLKELLDLTDGNLASHLTALERENYIEVQKQFIGKKPNTSYLLTDAGRAAFRSHLDALEAMLREMR